MEIPALDKDTKRSIFPIILGWDKCFMCNNPLGEDIDNHHYRDKTEVISKMWKKSISDIFCEICKTGPLHKFCHSKLVKQRHKHLQPSIDQKIEQWWKEHFQEKLIDIINLSETENLSNTIKLALKDIPRKMKFVLSQESEKDNFNYLSALVGTNINTFIDNNVHFTDGIIYPHDYIKDCVEDITPVRVFYFNTIYRYCFSQCKDTMINTSDIARYIYRELGNPEQKPFKTIMKDIGWMINSFLKNDPYYSIYKGSSCWWITPRREKLQQLIQTQTITSIQSNIV